MRLRRLAPLAVTALVAACADNKTTAPADTTSIPLDDFNVVKTTLNDEAYSGATNGTNFLVAFATSPSNQLTATPAVQMISRTAKIGGPITFPTNKNDIGVVAYDGTRYLTVMPDSDLCQVQLTARIAGKPKVRVAAAVFGY